MKVNVIEIQSKLLKNLEKSQYDHVTKIEKEMKKKDGRKGRKRRKMIRINIKECVNFALIIF